MQKISTRRGRLGARGSRSKHRPTLLMCWARQHTIRRRCHRRSMRVQQRLCLDAHMTSRWTSSRSSMAARAKSRPIYSRHTTTQIGLAQEQVLTKITTALLRSLWASIRDMAQTRQAPLHLSIKTMPTKSLKEKTLKTMAAFS